jgi:diaminopimelate epimerase
MLGFLRAMGAAAIHFDKYEGLGNDFIVARAANERDVPPDRAPALCDRRFGIGADGILLILPPRRAGCDARMRVINADGSIPEMCGNGVRCVALHLASERGVREAELRIDTDAGDCACRVEVAASDARVAVDMGFVRPLGPRSIDVDGKSLTIELADAGNPHAILFGAFGRGDVESLGPRIATHRDFPRGTNVEFALVAASGIDLVVWERGVGITMACGTGACATAAVACRNGLLAYGAPIAVRLPGGRLDVTVADSGRVNMTGPARRVYSGVLA